MIKEYGWAIKGNFGFYIGWWFTRRDAIFGHCNLKGKTWEQCYRDGDRAVKIVIQEIASRKKRLGEV